MKIGIPVKKTFYKMFWLRTIAVVFMLSILVGCGAEKSESPVPNTLFKQEEIVKEKPSSKEKILDKKQKDVEKDKAEKIELEATVPLVETPAPVAEKPAPIAETPAPAAEKPAPIAEKPASIAEKPASIAEKPAPIAEKPAPVAEKPAPVVEKLPPTEEAPAPPRVNSTVTAPAVDKIPVAEDPVTNEVYITNSGTKYHRGSCGHLKDSKISISKDEAIRKGYEPCKTCKP